MIKQMYQKLKQDGLNPYFIGQHTGIATRNYAVVREGAQIQSSTSNKLGQQVLEVLIFVPANSYIQVEQYEESIRQSMKTIKFLRKTGYESPIITDDTKKAYTKTIQYVIMKKLEG